METKYLHYYFLTSDNKEYVMLRTLCVRNGIEFKGLENNATPLTGFHIDWEKKICQRDSQWTTRGEQLSFFSVERFNGRMEYAKVFLRAREKFSDVIEAHRHNGRECNLEFENCPYTHHEHILRCSECGEEIYRPHYDKERVEHGVLQDGYMRCKFDTDDVVTEMKPFEFERMVFRHLAKTR